MEKKLRTGITEEQWQRAVDDYERGTKHGVEIANDLGVSASTVSREFKRRGCVKASRVAEVMAPIEAALDRRARRRAVFQRARDEAAAQRAAANDALIDEMMRSLVAAMKAGDLTLAAPKVNEIGKSLGVKVRRI
jgi:IS30 family transposase